MRIRTWSVAMPATAGVLPGGCSRLLRRLAARARRARSVMSPSCRAWKSPLTPWSPSLRPHGAVSGYQGRPAPPGADACAGRPGRRPRDQLAGLRVDPLQVGDHLLHGPVQAVQVQPVEPRLPRLLAYA